MDDKPPSRPSRRRPFGVAASLLSWYVLIGTAVHAAAADVPVDSTLDAGSALLHIGVCVGLLLLSAMISGAEAAINELDTWHYRGLSDDETEENGALALFERDPQRIVSTLVITRTLVNVAIAAFVTFNAMQLSSQTVPEWRAALYGALVAGLLILVFGQIIPRAVVVPNAVRVSRLVMRPVYLLSIVIYPIGAAFTWLTRQVLRLFRIEQGNDSHISEDELKQVLRDAEESGIIEAQERQMIRGVIDLEETVVREVMTPRVDVVAIASDASLSELLELVMDEGYSRLPVYAESIDNVVGMVYARDLLKFRGSVSDDDVTVAELMTTTQYVPETLSVSNLLRDMRVRKSHFAVVVDEFGGTSGVVTLEDIIEEITGEIYDETDEDEDEDIVALPGGGFRLLGSAHLESIGMALDIDFDEDGDYDTLAGFMIDELGRIPNVGEAVVHGGMRFEVEQSDGRRIVSVVATPVPTEGTPVSDQLAAEASASAPAELGDVDALDALGDADEDLVRHGVDGAA